MILKALQNKYDKIIYSYVPGEYMPIFMDGKLLNKSEFIRYKLGKGFMRFCDRFEQLQKKVDGL